MLNDEVKKDFHLPHLLSNPIVDVNNPLPNVVHSGRILVRFYPNSFQFIIQKVKYCEVHKKKKEKKNIFLPYVQIMFL